MRPAKTILTIALLTATAHAQAQPRMEVANDVLNLGDILFQQPRSIRFEIKNTGTEALQLTAVTSSCGCTEVRWPQTPIAAGASGTIEAVYDARLLGTFQKEIEVHTNASEAPVYLTFQGRVVQTTDVDPSNYPIDLGNVRLSTNVVEFDDVNNGDHPEYVLHVLNPTRESYQPLLMHLPPYLTARYQPEKLAGGRAGRIVLTLDSERLKQYGLTQTTVYLARKLGDKVGAENEISISTVLLPGFAHLTAEEMATAPHLQLSADSLDFGTLGKRKRATQTIAVTNTGQRPLIVSAVQVYGKALTVSLSSRTIQPGQQAKLKVTVTTEYLRRERQQPRVLIIANDPSRPKTTIGVKAQ